MAGIYRNLFELVSGTITLLDFSNLDWGDEEAKLLARALPEMAALASLE